LSSIADTVSPYSDGISSPWKLLPMTRRGVSLSASPGTGSDECSPIPELPSSVCVRSEVTSPQQSGSGGLLDLLVVSYVMRYVLVLLLLVR
jgi:hypothetical protein